MNRRIVTCASIEAAMYGAEIALEIDFGDHPVVEVCLGLCLLTNELVGSLTLVGKGEMSITIHRVYAGKSSPLLSNGNGSYQIALDTDALEYWMYFFLRYYRDGFAEVDHIHIGLDTDGGCAELTVKVANYAAPVPEHEARRRLGL